MLSYAGALCVLSGLVLTGAKAEELLPTNLQLLPD